MVIGGMNMNNADRIRNMTNEELADLFDKVISGHREEIGIKCGNDKCDSWKCTECILTWLKTSID